MGEIIPLIGDPRHTRQQAMKWKLTLVVVLLMVTLGSTILAQAGQITSNSYEDTSPYIKGNYLVWQGFVGGDWDIFLYNIATGETIQITNNDYGDVSPQTDGHYVVWLGFSNSGGEIFLYDITTQTTTQITTDTNVDSPPQIANGVVIWAAQEVTTSVEPGDIFLYRTGTQQTEQLTDNALDDSSPGINDVNVVWTQKNGSNTTLFMYDLPSGPSYEAPEGYERQDSPQTDGNLTVYARVVGDDREIFVRNTRHTGLKTSEQITDNAIVDKYPRISGNNIAWVGGEGQASEIFLASYGPVIERLRPRNCNPREILRIIGSGFGNTQGDSVLHIGPRTYDSSSSSIRLWSDTRIRIRIPFKKKPCDWYTHGDLTYRKRKVWVTVGGVDSNKKRFRVLKPLPCP
jgi:beta propeller repeat protein